MINKILLSLLLFTSFVYASSGGCILTQDKNIKVKYTTYNKISKVKIFEDFTNIKYAAKLIEGKNFKELFVGSKLSIDTTSSKLSIPNIEATITNIKANKRIKGKPRTGTIQLLVTLNNKELNIPMRYNYDNGYFEATGDINLKDFNLAINTFNKITIKLSTNIKALLCNVKTGK